MRAAATLILAREGSCGPEVLLVERGADGDFPGLHVFPGGLVDPGDADPRLLRASRLDAASAAALLAVDDALPAFVAALRECVEECGVLPGAPAGIDLGAWQRELLSRATSFADLVSSAGVQLHTDALGYFSHWITPVGIPRRYDTRFFLARLPAEQQPRVDGREAVRADWFRPADALAAHARGDIRLIFPTIRNLEALAGVDELDALLAAARQPRPVPAMLPRLVNGSAGVRLLLPGDDGYDAA